MVSKPVARRKSSVSPARDRSKSMTPPPQSRTTASTAKPGVMQFQSKGARNEMELHFDRFLSLDRSAQTDAITGRGLTQFLSEIAVPPTALDYYVVVWKLGATQRACITRAEWIMAMYVHDVETLAQLKLKAAEWVRDVRGNGGSFLLMYNFVYDYIRGEEDRRMSLANAIKAWDVLFDKKAWYVKWKPWAAEHITPDVSRDLWRQVGVLLTLEADPRQSGGDGTAASTLPTVIVEFLEQGNVAA